MRSVTDLEVVLLRGVHGRQSGIAGGETAEGRAATLFGVGWEEERDD